MNLSQAVQPPPPRSSILARLAIEDDRAALRDLFRARLTAVSPWLEFDAATADQTITNYFETANPTLYVAETADRRIVGYVMACFEEYSSTAGFAVCQDELHVEPGLAAAEAAAALSGAFEDWVKQLKPAPLEVLVGVDVDLHPVDVARLQSAGGH